MNPKTLKEINKLKQSGVIGGDITKNNVTSYYDPSWKYPPEKAILKKASKNKSLFVGYELDYIEKNSKASIKNAPNEIDHQSMIDEKVEQEYKKWRKKNDISNQMQNWA